MADIDLLGLTAHAALTGLANKSFTSEQLVHAYTARIDRHDGRLRAVLQRNPNALLEARERDRQRDEGDLLGPLHGLPLLIKASLATVPKLGMDTTSGNFALRGSRPRRNAEVVEMLLNSGAIVLGKTTLSELSYWKIAEIPAGWSPVGGQGQNPYVSGGRQPGDPIFSFNGPGGSSSGSSIGVAAGFAPVAIGTETSGSLIFPADRAALFTIKPSAGLVPQGGVVPVSYRFDTAGPLAKCSHDVALVLDVLVDKAAAAAPAGGYVAAIKGSAGWSGLKVGVLDTESWLHDDALVGGTHQAKEQMIHEISAAYDLVGSKVHTLRPAHVPSSANAIEFQKNCGSLMIQLYEHDHGRDLAHYLSTVDNSVVHSLQDLLNTAEEFSVLATPNGQAGRAFLERAVSGPISTDEARDVDARMREASRENGIDAALRGDDGRSNVGDGADSGSGGVDVLLGPANGPLYSLAAAAGYPVATLPLSYLEANGCPFGLVAIASARREALLLTVQSAWEETFPKRRTPPEM